MTCPKAGAAKKTSLGWIRSAGLLGLNFYQEQSPDLMAYCPAIKPVECANHYPTKYGPVPFLQVEEGQLHGLKITAVEVLKDENRLHRWWTPWRMVLNMFHLGREKGV